jgi:hypothetical protein
MKLYISRMAGIAALVSLLLPWWRISGLGPEVGISPLFLVKLALHGAGEGIIELSEGFSGIVLLSVAFVVLSGLGALLRWVAHRRALSFLAGIVMLSALNLLTYAFVYLRIAGSVLCLTPSIYGAPLGWGIHYGFAVAALSGLAFLLSALYDL